MLTVRYPDGKCLQYNSAEQVHRTQGGYELVNKTDHWVVLVPYAAGAVIEASAPCRIYGPGTTENRSALLTKDEIRIIVKRAIASERRANKRGKK